ncbi:MAG: FtsW/RodA/SpoVE family cell cycle protein [Candidatus Absconditabacteria bacterium]
MPILIIGALLILYGVFAIFSVSIYESFQLTLKMVNLGKIAEPYNLFYFFKQLTSLAIGIIVAFGVYKIPLKFIQKYKLRLFIIVLIFQLLVFTPLGVMLNGAKGWLYFPGLGTIQPSEFFKLAFVMFMAGWLIKKKKILSSIQGFIGFLVVIGIFFFVFFLIPDLGTLLVLGPVVMVMYRYVGGRFRYIMLLSSIGLIMGVTIGMQFSYIRDRFSYFLDSSVDETGRGIGYQISQGLISIGGGGVFGQGYGKGLQKFGYIPEAQSDFIFAAFSEEVGLIGNSILLSMYFFLVYYFMKRVSRVADEYNRVFGVGIIALLVVQIFVNIGGITKILPLTGLTLPFISYGGTALMINLVELTLLYKIINSEQIPNNGNITPLKYSNSNKIIR